MITQSDILRGLATIEDQSVDLIISDPPYSAGSDHERGKSTGTEMIRREGAAKVGWIVGDDMGTEGLRYLLREIAVEALRVLKPGGIMLTFMDWRMLPTCIPAISSAGVRYNNLVIWDKGHGGQGRGFRAQHESIIVHTKGLGNFQSSESGNVINNKRINTTQRTHPTEKPAGLIAYILKICCPVPGHVVDCFSGSGVVSDECARAGIDCTAFDLSGKYVRIGNERLAQKMF